MTPQVEFTGSFTKISQCPTDGLPEFAFIGRSNVGKSSLINALAKQKGLAKTSSTPGKTQLMNFFRVELGFFIVDLPGYGYARVSKTQRESWNKNTLNYIVKRENLAVLIVLIDSNIPPQKIDLDFVNMLGQEGVPFIIVFTKLDKGKMNAIEGNIKMFRQELKKSWENLPLIIKTSALRHTGCDELYSFMLETVGKLQN
jgi:GTP-binding protein